MGGTPPRTRLLFVCTENKQRSPTGERLYADYPGLETRSAGIREVSKRVLTVEDLAWADLVLVMQRRHLVHIKSVWPDWFAEHGDRVSPHVRSRLAQPEPHSR